MTPADRENQATRNTSKLLEAIQTIQAQLGLTNRAILALMTVPVDDEADFFGGQASLTIYEQTLKQLTVIQRSLAQQSVALSAYLQQLRLLPPHNIFLRNRYAFWFKNFIEAGGSADCLIRDAKENGFEIIDQIVWSGNLLVSTAGVAHLKTHQKQLLHLTAEAYQVIREIMKHFSTASPLFFLNLKQLYMGGIVTGSSTLQQYWDREAVLVNVDD